MNTKTEQNLILKIKTLSPRQVAEVENFVEFLAAKARKQSAMERLLAIAPELEAAGAPSMSEDEIAAEVEAVRTNRRASQQSAGSDTGSGAGRS